MWKIWKVLTTLCLLSYTHIHTPTHRYTCVEILKGLMCVLDDKLYVKFNVCLEDDIIYNGVGKMECVLNLKWLKDGKKRPLK